MLSGKLLRKLRVEPGERVKLKHYDPAWDGAGGSKALGEDELKVEAEAELQRSVAELDKAQELLYASDTASVLIVLQGMDASGKDGTIKHVMSGINPQGCEVHSFKKPSAEELDHDFLWRYARHLPERGRIGIFNRSYFEEVLVVKVHPELLDAQRVPGHKRGKPFWDARYQDINHFEKHLSRNGTLILKFFLHISKHEQRRRLLARLDDPRKTWKFSADDLAERRHWDDYMKAYEDALTATSTKHAPWHIIPADHKWVTRTLVADIIAAGVRGLDLHYPKVTDAQRRRLAQAKRMLEHE